MPNNLRPAGTRNWRGSWQPTSLPRRHTWIGRLAVFSQAQELRGRVRKLEWTASMLPVSAGGGRTERNGAFYDEAHRIRFSGRSHSGGHAGYGLWRAIRASVRLCPSRPQGREASVGQEV